jgi:hypothetical protein
MLKRIKARTTAVRLPIVRYVISALPGCTTFTTVKYAVNLEFNISFSQLQLFVFRAHLKDTPERQKVFNWLHLHIRKEGQLRH